MKRVLIVEDEQAIANVLADYCQHNQFVPTICIDEQRIIETIQNNLTDIVLLDLMLPNIDGLALCKTIRQHSTIPIVIISARVDEVDRLLGLELGADDYICKPFSPREVMARIKATLRRVHTSFEQGQANAESSENASTNAANKLTLEKSQLHVYWQGKGLSLTAVEFSLLEALSQHSGHILSRQQLMDRGYTDHRIVSDRTIDSHIKKLRQKLATAFPKTRFIESVYGAGYRIDIQPYDVHDADIHPVDRHD